MDGWNDEHKVRVRAYHLWEAEGRPEGREGEFWARALQLEQQANAPSQDAGPSKAKRAAAAKSPSAKPAKAPRPSESKGAPKRRARATAGKGATGTAAVHMQPASAERP